MQTSTDPTQLFGHDVVDSTGNKIGSVDNVWVDDATSALEFISVKTGWLMGKSHVIPATSASIANDSITVPYDESQIKDAPSYGADEELSPDQENEIYSFYGIDRSTSTSPTGLSAGTDGTYGMASTTDTSGYATDTSPRNGEEALTLSEEELQVGKRNVEAGRVRLRKVMTTERKEVPVELRRESVEVERLPADAVSATAGTFQESEIEVPVMREEPVVSKEAHVTGGVRLTKGVETETRTVGGDIRREDVEVDRDTGIATTEE